MNEQLLGIYEIAQIANVTTAAVNNWRKRYSDFPQAIERLKSGPVFRAWEIDLWLSKKGYFISNKLFIPDGSATYKKIVVVGLPRMGKSRTIARFIKYYDLFIKYFVGDGVDFTKVNIKLIAKKKSSNLNDTIKFSSPNSTLNGMQETFNDVGVSKFLDNIKNHNIYSKNHQKAGKNKDLDLYEDWITITTEASELAMSIMDPNDEGLIATDTPGVFGEKVQCLHNVSDADLYLFVMSPATEEVFADGINKMLPVLAGSKIIFLYRMGTNVDDEEDYNIMLEKARIGMHDFTDHLKLLCKESIIRTAINVLNPTATVIPIGSFHDRKINFAEKKFNKALSEALIKSFNDNPYEVAEKEITLALTRSKNKDTIIEAIKSILNIYNKKPYSINDNKPNYLEEFLNQNHDRVKFNDDERTLTIVNKNRVKLLRELFTYFDSLEIDSTIPVDVTLQKTIIKYCYIKLANAIKFDCGISRGDHPFESYPPITMWAEEAMIAEDLIKASQPLTEENFCSIMKSKGFTSKSWNYVSIPKKPYDGEKSFCNKKLEVIVSCGLNKLPSSNSEELIFNSYNLALLNLGKYAICKFMIDAINSEDNAIDWVKSLNLLRLQ